MKYSSRTVLFIIYLVPRTMALNDHRSNETAVFYVQETIKDAIEDSITWPVRKIVSILPGDYRCANSI